MAIDAISSKTGRHQAAAGPSTQAASDEFGVILPTATATATARASSVQTRLSAM
ncbi:MAG TPA: hypothetical protein VGC30_03595 [Dokdonella sp.]